MIENQKTVIQLIIIQCFSSQERHHRLTSPRSTNNQMLALKWQGSDTLLFLAEILNSGKLKSTLRHLRSPLRSPAQNAYR